MVCRFGLSVDASCLLDLASLDLFWNKSSKMINKVIKHIFAISVISNCDRVISVSDNQYSWGLLMELWYPPFLFCIKKIAKERSF